MHTVANVIEYLQQLAPLELAADWDNVGLLLGHADAPVHKVMTCLTVTPESAAEAVEAGANLIVSHHPVLFRPVQKLTGATPEGRMLLALLHASVAVYSPHTALDNAPGGINDLLARKLELTEVTPLAPREAKGQCKIVVFVPDGDLAKVSDALFAAGAGRIGEYGECSFRLAGTGTFFGSDAANPVVGQKGRREEVSEWRLEVVCPAEQVERAVRAMKSAHSYEEPAFDVYPLRASTGKEGEGRVGTLTTPMTLHALGERLKSNLPATRVDLVGAPERRVERVAIVCGAGGSFLTQAVKTRADVLLTGEARFHDYLAAQAAGVALLLPGHYATERCGVVDLAERLASKWPALEVWASRSESDPVTAT
ncbi:MAG: Nif3-like dinuclear metal center hexameric protein [Gemmataceae bacterium]